jgi:2-amino-4-hydroxy-6-hydroxymethyldihydropteridine diphosphokinase
MKNVTKVYLGIGSNLGDRSQNLEIACKAFPAAGRSSIYETEPVGFLEQPWFLNMVIEAYWSETPRQLLQYCQKIELQMGRTRTVSKGPRTIDLDILFFGDQIIQEPDLVIPHPEISKRRFVLEPLSEIAPYLEHPLLKETIAELLAGCMDHSIVHRL